MERYREAPPNRPLWSRCEISGRQVQSRGHPECLRAFCRAVPPSFPLLRLSPVLLIPLTGDQDLLDHSEAPYYATRRRRAAARRHSQADPRIRRPDGSQTPPPVVGEWSRSWGADRSQCGRSLSGLCRRARQAPAGSDREPGDARSRSVRSPRRERSLRAPCGTRRFAARGAGSRPGESSRPARRSRWGGVFSDTGLVFGTMSSPSIAIGRARMTLALLRNGSRYGASCPAARGGRRRGASILLLKSSQRASATAMSASGIEAVSLRSM